MKKLAAMVMVFAMILALGTTAFAEGRRLTLEEAKQAALDYVGLNVYETVFTKAYRDWDDGREVYELEFYANGTEYDMDVDVNTGRITDFSTDYHGDCNGSYSGYYDDDRFDHDNDWDDLFDFDYDGYDWD